MPRWRRRADHHGAAELVTRPVLRAPDARRSRCACTSPATRSCTTPGTPSSTSPATPRCSTPTLHYENATGLTRPDFFDWPAALADDMDDPPAAEVVFLLFGGNDAQGLVTPDGDASSRRSTDPAWQAEYGRRVGAGDGPPAGRRPASCSGSASPDALRHGFDAKAAIMNNIYRRPPSAGRG